MMRQMILLCLIFGVVRGNSVDDQTYSTPSVNDSNADSDWDSSTLIFTSVLFRGGVHAFEQNNIFPHLDNPFVEKRGVLTKLGKQQSFQMGIYLRERYGNMYNNSYDPYLVRLWTSKSNHCLEATQLLAAGMFPPVADHDFWHQNLTWLPVPYHVDLKIGLAGAFLAIYLPICDSLTYVYGTTEFKSFGEANDGLIKFLCNMAGIEDEEDYEPFEAFKVSSSLQILSYYPELVPSWANDTILKQVEGYYYGFLKLLGSYYPVQRIAAGWLLGDVIDEMLVHLRTKSKRKFVAYSGHDDVLVPLLWLLGEVPERWPAFGSMLSVELHKKDDKEYVQLWYWYDVQTDPRRLKVWSCSTDPCTLAEFAELGKHNPREKWALECWGEITPSTSREWEEIEISSSHMNMWICLTALFLALTVLMTTLFVLARRRLLQNGSTTKQIK